jgi:hypothetical protein
LQASAAKVSGVPRRTMAYSLALPFTTSMDQTDLDRPAVGSEGVLLQGGMRISFQQQQLQRTQQPAGILKSTTAYHREGTCWLGF